MTVQEHPPERAPSAESILRRALRAATSTRAKRIQVRLFAAALFALGILLAFSPAAFDFVATFTERPEVLPVALLVPYVYLVFQFVVWSLERDEEAEVEQLRYEERRREVAERLVERKATIMMFERSLGGSRQLDTQETADELAGWIAQRAGGVIEVLMLCYSSETFLPACLRAAGRMQQPPEEIRFKLLTRDLSAPWNVPLLQQAAADQEYRSGLNARFGQVLERWRNELPAAYDRVLRRDQLKLEVRCYPFEPLLKGAVVNREVGLVGIYGHHTVSHSQISGWDYHGHGTTLYCTSSLPGATPSERQALGDLLGLFDDLWDRHSRVLEEYSL